MKKIFSLLIRPAGRPSKSITSFITFHEDIKIWAIAKDSLYEHDWKVSFSGEFENAAAKLGEKIFLPQKSMGPMAFIKGENWEFKLCQFGVPLASLKENADRELEQTIELIPRGKNKDSKQAIHYISF